MNQLTDSPAHTEGLQAASDHLVKAAEQLRRFSVLGFGAQGDIAAAEVEKFANVLRAWSPRAEN
jgi:hypothetical protein